jgi:KDO2-lipid IV(A) lauroyltransferase
MNGDPALEPETEPDTATGAIPAVAAGSRGERLHHRVLAGALGLCCALIGRMPAALAYALADLAALPFALYWGLRDRHARSTKGYWRNVRIVCRPGSPLPQRPGGHLWHWARHMTWLLVDFCRLRRITTANVERLVDCSEVTILRGLMAEGRGVIVATGHVGMWDVPGHAAGLLGIPLTSVYRPSPIPAVDRLIARLRGTTGQNLVLRRGAIWPLKRALADARMLGLVVDGGGKGGRLFAPFLGTLASGHPTPALLQLATGAPIAVLSCPRTGRGRFRMRIHDVIRHAATGDRDADLLAITTRINDGLSRAILEHPEQWFWQGNRFRHRPPGEVPGPDGLPPLHRGPA